MAAKRKPFGKSQIVAKKIPKNLKKRSLAHARRIIVYSITKSGKDYLVESERLRVKFSLRTKDKKKISTAMAFVRNYFVKYGEVPTMEQLEKIFPYLKKK